MSKKLSAKSYVNISIIYAAVFAIYNIIVMLLFDGKNEIFWTSYAFLCVSFAVNIFLTLFTLRNADVEAVFWGIPLLSFSVFYFFGELFISFVFMLFRNVAGIKLTISIQAIFMLIFVIIAGVAILTRNTAASITENIETKVQSIKMLSVDVKLLEDQCMDAELKKELHKITEAIRYSDPMTHEALADLDNIIRSKVSELKYQCNSSNKNEAIQLCFQLNSYISERNQKLILLK